MDPARDHALSEAPNRAFARHRRSITWASIRSVALRPSPLRPSRPWAVLRVSRAHAAPGSGEPRAGLPQRFGALSPGPRLRLSVPSPLPDGRIERRGLAVPARSSHLLMSGAARRSPILYARFRTQKLRTQEALTVAARRRVGGRGPAPCPL